MPRFPGEGWMLLCCVWLTQIHHPTPDTTGVSGSSSLSKLGFFFFFFLVLTLQWNPFIPCLAEDVKLFCQGSWMQGKLGWGFPCPELACSVCWSGLCVVLWPWGSELSQLEELSGSGHTWNFRSQPAPDQLPCGQKDKPLTPWAAPRMLWSFHSPPLFFWQCCSLQGSEASSSQGEDDQCESTLSQTGPALLPSSPGVHGQPALCPCPPALPRAVPWSVQPFPNACTDEFLVLLRQDSPGTLDHLASLIILVLFWCAVQWSVQVHTLHRPFGNCWSVFSRIRVIQTSCTCGLKSCNPGFVLAPQSMCVSGSPITHLKIYRHWH